MYFLYIYVRLFRPAMGKVCGFHSGIGGYPADWAWDCGFVEFLVVIPWVVRWLMLTERLDKISRSGPCRAGLANPARHDPYYHSLFSQKAGCQDMGDEAIREHFPQPRMDVSGIPPMWVDDALYPVYTLSYAMLAVVPFGAGWRFKARCGPGLHTHVLAVGFVSVFACRFRLSACPGSILPGRLGPSDH